MRIEQLREIVPAPNQNTVAVCNQINLLILYHINARLVNLLQIADAPWCPYTSLIFFVLLLVSSSSILAFGYSFLLFPNVY